VTKGENSKFWNRGSSDNGEEPRMDTDFWGVLFNGPPALPGNFINNRTVLNANSVQVRQLAMNGSSFTITIQLSP
jgi:hypothetical protein